MPKKPEVSKEVAPVASEEQKAIAELRKWGGAGDTVATLPSFALEHTTVAGEANLLKGHFTLSTRDMYGEWLKQDLGSEVELHILIQRYIISLVDTDGARYSSPEFDHPNEPVKLFKSVGQGSDKKNSLHGEGIYADLSREFMVEEKGRSWSKLKLLYVLYCEYQGQIIKWRTNGSATGAYRKYARATTPFAVITKLTPEEKVKGSNKYYAPVFTVVKPVTDFAAVLAKQQEIRAAFELAKGSAHFNADAEKDTGTPTFD